MCANALGATSLEGPIIHLVLVGLNLDGGMNGVSKIVVSMLVYD